MKLLETLPVGGGNLSSIKFLLGFHVSGFFFFLCALKYASKLTHTYLTSKARANIPAARGAEADVPVCESVHRP